MPKYSLESILSNITDYTNDAVLITEAEPIDAPGPVIVFVNPTFTHLTGYLASEVIGKSPRLLQGEGTSASARQEIRAALQAWRPVVTEILNYKKDGAPFWSELSIVPVADSKGWYRYWISVQRDTTQIRQQQHDLTLRSLAMDVSSDAIAVCALAGETPKIVYGNKPFTALLENGSQTAEQDLLDLFPPARRQEARAALRRSLRLERTQTLEETLSPPGRGSIDASISLEPVPAGMLGDQMVLVSIRDVTEEQARKREIAEAQRLRAIGQVTGGVAHDFNNLLTIMTHCAEILLTRSALSKDDRSLVQTIADTADRGASLTAQLLSFARRRPLETQHVAVKPFLQRVRDMLRRVMPSTMDLQLSIAPDVVGVRADPAQLETALLNLVINARDAMQSHGTIRIVAENRSIDRRTGDMTSDGPPFEPGDYVCLSVIDDGPGMSLETQQRAFEPFFTTKGVGLGSGLGLSMVYGFAQQSGGNARIVSEPGAGAAVEILLPRSDHAPSDVASDVRDNPSVDLRLVTVLVVEDNDGVREQAARLVQGMGCRTYVASDAAEALRIVGDHPDVDVLFTDVVMAGGASGVQLAKEALAMRPELKLLFTSGYSEEDPEVMRALSDGAPLLKKPYRRMDLRQALARVALG